MRFQWQRKNNPHRLYCFGLPSYEGHDSARLAAGLHSYVIGRGLQDSNMVMVALKVDDTTKAKAFAKDPGLRTAMKKGGVLGAPMIAILTATWQDTAKIETTLRSRAERIDNGIVDRVVGHDLDDNKKVYVVTAITDSAKAFAYYKSDGLKKKIQASGVVGEPDRFIYRLVKHY